MACSGTLQSLSSQIDDPGSRRVVTDISEAVRGGIPLAKALEGHPEMFPELYSSMVRAGEEAGMLPLALERLADHLEEQAIPLRAAGKRVNQTRLPEEQRPVRRRPLRPGDLNERLPRVVGKGGRRLAAR